jgi:hypothetical protein
MDAAALSDAVSQGVAGPAAPAVAAAPIVLPPLPHLPSSFVGREREVAEAAGFLRGGARLVTLPGAGGGGKTRLAIRVAGALAAEPAGGSRGG